MNESINGKSPGKQQPGDSFVLEEDGGLRQINTKTPRKRKLARLSSDHQEYLRVRGVSDSIAKQRGYITVRLDEQLEEYGFSDYQQITPTLLIPIHGVDGSIKFYQHRPDEPRTRYNKIIKFETAAGSRNALDIHPAMRKWIGNPKIPKIITEGSPKVDACLSIGLPAIGLMGVSSFRGKNDEGGLVALADWESIAINGCTFYLAFDSDVMLKESVYLSLTRVKRFLESRRGIVKAIYMPQPSEDSTANKIGIDDYITQQRAAKLTDRQIRDALLKKLAVDELRSPPIQGVDLSDRRPSIEIRSGYVPNMVDSVVTVLSDRERVERLQLFQRSGQVQQVIALTEQEAEVANKQDKIYRPPGSVILHQPSMIQMVDIIERETIWWYRKASKDGKYNRVISNCPKDVAQRYLEHTGKWKLPHLLGVIEAPLVLPDGTILREPGYNAATGLFLFSEIQWPEIKRRPTKKDALAALATLRQPFSEFPFISKTDDGKCRTDESVVLSEVLTAIQRRLIDHAPLYGHDAPSQGSGKGLSVKVTSLIATGRSVTSTAVARDEDEIRKSMFSLLREGHQLINLDNITEVLKSPTVAKMITEETLGDRVLGVTKSEEVGTQVLVTATGNNMRFGGDLTSRVLITRIDAKMDRPDQRRFKRENLATWVLENRIKLVTAALTILSAWFLAGRPSQRVEPWDRFPQWSRDIREALVWLGCDDPCVKRDAVFEDDPERASSGDVLRLWYKALGSTKVTTAEVVDNAQKNSFKSPEFYNLLLQIARSKSASAEIDPTRLGLWCAKNRDRVIDDYRLWKGEQSKKSKRSGQWMVDASAADKPTKIRR